MPYIETIESEQLRFLSKYSGNPILSEAIRYFDLHNSKEMLLDTPTLSNHRVAMSDSVISKGKHSDL